MIKRKTEKELRKELKILRNRLDELLEDEQYGRCNKMSGYIEGIEFAIGWLVSQKEQ